LILEIAKQTQLKIEETYEFSREDLVSKIKLCEDKSSFINHFLLSSKL